ncbi:hypothetical protein [Nocardioides marmotae]|uniref:hypothetical protein n=1 Tax=Nocardioides marmotae TaxID=2663857 RepID=UPI0014959A04|nr:hypothetical protein [Nocardioides marmotae]QKE00300.1 hypothetical protein HPC71_03795 [Nocardioides marmotae]
MAHLYPKGAANPVRYTTVAALTGVTPSTVPSVVHPTGEASATAPTCVLLRLRRTWHDDMTPEELYDATRGYWAMSLSKAETITRAFAVARGIVREVYEPVSWVPSPEPGEEHRIGFEGVVASDRDRWIGRDVSSVFPQGSQNPVRYVTLVDLDGPDPTGRPAATGTESPPAGRGTEPDFVERVEPLLDALEGDLLWSMSRAAQELFHSNTLSWLLSEHPDAAASLAAVFDPAGAGALEVWREYRHIDLVARRGQGAGRFVVENKLYSIPYPEQLTRYAEVDLPWSAGHGSCGATDTSYFLLTLMDPTFDLPSPWRRLSYEQVLTALDAIDVEELGRDADLVTRYRALVRRLVQLKGAVDPRENPDEPFSVRAALAGLGHKGFVGPLQRMRFTGLAQMTTEEYGTPVPLHVDITRAMGLITYERRLSATRSIGWQLQEGQLRLFVLVRDAELAGPGPDRAAARARVAEAEYADFVDFDPAEQVLGDLLLPKHFPTGHWQRFAPDFVYRYRKVDELVTTRQLAEALAELTAYVDAWRLR